MVRLLGATIHGATGFKNMPLASILKMEIPELRFAGRPPNKISENEVAVAGPGAAPGPKIPHRGRALGRF